MRNSLILQDKNYVSARRVQELFGYSSDYVGQLCRLGKIEAKMIGRTWFVTEKSIIDHKLSVNDLIREKNKEKRKLSKKIYNDSIKSDALVSCELMNTVETNNVACVDNKIVETVNATNATEFKVSTTSQVIACDPSTLRLMPNVPELFSLPYFVSESFLIAPNCKKSEIFSPSSAKLIFTSTLCVLGLFFMLQSIAVNTNAINQVASKISDDSLSANVLDGSQNFIKDSFAFVRSIPTLAKGIFVNKTNNLVEEDANLAPEDSVYTSNANDIAFNGFAVVPSSNSKDKDEEIKNKIKESFSDEVIVKPDNSGTSGIITPVFKEARGSDFIYVLVPVNDKTK
jgi:hypothetical protein